MNPRMVIGTTLACALALTACDSGSAPQAASSTAQLTTPSWVPDVARCVDALRSLDAQTGALRTALVSLETAVSSMAANPSGDKVPAVQSAMDQVKAAGEDLATAASRGCPSVLPSPSR